MSEKDLFSKKDLLKEMAVSALFCLLISYTFYKSILVFLVLLPVALIAWPRFQKKKIIRKNLDRLNNGFKEGIGIVSGYLSAGYSVENAFVNAVSELKKLYGEKDLITVEFMKIVKGIRLNKQVEDLLMDFAVRTGLPDIKNFAEVFSIAKRSGGNLKDIIESTVNVIREKAAVHEEIMCITAAKRYEQGIMNLLPFGIIIYVDMTTGGFLDVMYETLTGRVVMTICLGTVFLSYYLSGKILDIKV